MMLEVDG